VRSEGDNVGGCVGIDIERRRDRRGGEVFGLEQFEPGAVVDGDIGGIGS
jgi:hypothetical protein